LSERWVSGVFRVSTSAMSRGLVAVAVAAAAAVVEDVADAPTALPEVATLTVTRLQDVVAVADAEVAAAEEVAAAVAASRSDRRVARQVMSMPRAFWISQAERTVHCVALQGFVGALVRHVTFDTHVLL
jgi:hypothetical protein